MILNNSVLLGLGFCAPLCVSQLSGRRAGSVSGDLSELHSGGVADRASLGGFALGDVTAHLAYMVNLDGLCQQVLKGPLVESRVSLFHVPGVAEGDDRPPIPLLLRFPDELGIENPDIVACDADLSKSTMSCLFADSFPNRFFEMGIAEANMISFAAGLSLAGKIPFVHTFAVFASGRPYDQIRVSVCIGNLNVKIIGSSAGLSDFGDGSTHQSIDDISVMRSIPNMTVHDTLDQIP